MPLDCSEDEIMADRSYCRPYFATPCHQQPKQTIEIRTIITYLLFTVPLHYSEMKQWHTEAIVDLILLPHAINNPNKPLK